jgi:protease I
MAGQLGNLKVAALVDNGFEESELAEPLKALKLVGADVEIVSSAGVEVKGWRHTNWGDIFNVDVALKDAKPDAYDALLLPGGVMNPDKLRMQPDAVDFVKQFAIKNKPIAAICHGPWTLVEADVVKGRTLTSWPSIKTDIKNAGGHWVDQEVVVDGNIVTSRKPEDIPAFNTQMIALFSQKVPAAGRA